MTSPDVTWPDIKSPGINLDDITSPEETLTDVTSPDVPTPDMTSPDVISPDITSPGITLANDTSPEDTSFFSDKAWFWQGGGGVGESSSISTSWLGAEHVLFDASLDGVGGDIMLEFTSMSVVVTESTWLLSDVGMRATSVVAIAFTDQEKKFCFLTTLFSESLSKKANLFYCDSPFYLFCLNFLQKFFKLCNCLFE